MTEIMKRTQPNEARIFVAWMLHEMDGWRDTAEKIIPDEDTIQKEIRKLETRLENLKLELKNKEVK